SSLSGSAGAWPPCPFHRQEKESSCQLPIGLRSRFSDLGGFHSPQFSSRSSPTTIHLSKYRAMTSWKVVAASVAGPHHVRDGLPCQDAHTYRLQGDYLIAVISDGAGSACYSQLGSQAITDTLVQVLAEADLQGLEAQTLQALVEAGVEQCRHNLVEAHPDTQLADFYATLLGVVAGPEGGFFFQIGDGLGAAIQEQRWAPCLLA